MTGRRTLLATAVALAAVAPRFGQAQKRDKVYRIGWLFPSPGSELTKAFIAGMRELGWVEGQDCTLEEFYSQGYDDRLPALAAEMVRRNVDLIVSTGTTATAAAKRADRNDPDRVQFGRRPGELEVRHESCAAWR